MVPFVLVCGDRAAGKPGTNCRSDSAGRMLGVAGGASVPGKVEKDNLVEEAAADLVLACFREELTGGLQAAGVSEKGPRDLDGRAVPQLVLGPRFAGAAQRARAVGARPLRPVEWVAALRVLGTR